MSDNLLPGNVSDFEKAVERASAGVGAVDMTPIGDLWNPWACSLERLTFLAWELSVDFWDEAWPEQTKRQVVADSIEWHAIKGTPAAVEMALASLGYQATQTEWFDQNPPGQRGTFAVAVDLGPRRITTWPTQEILRAINRSKRLSQHLAGLTYRSALEGSVYLGSSYRAHRRCSIKSPAPHLTLNGGTFLGAAYRIKKRIRINAA